MHLHVHVDPQQSPRAKGEATGAVGHGATIDMRDVADRRHDRCAGAVESRTPAQGSIQKELRRDRLHQARLQRQHAGAEIPRGKDTLRQSHRAGGHEMASSG